MEIPKDKNVTKKPPVIKKSSSTKSTEKKVPRKASTTQKSTTTKSVKTTSAKDSIKSKAKSELQKKAVKAKATATTDKKTTRKPRITTPTTETKDKVNQVVKKDIIKSSVDVPTRKSVKGIPSAKLGVFTKGTTEQSTSNDNKSKTWKQGELDLKVDKKIEEKKIVKEISKPGIKKEKVVDKEQPPKQQIKTLSKPTSVKVPKSPSSNTSVKSKQPTAKPTTKKKSSGARKSTGKKKKSKKIKGKKNLFKILIILFVLILLLLVIYLFISNRFFKDGEVEVENSNSLTIFEPKITSDLNSEFIYVGDNLKDLETLSENNTNNEPLSPNENLIINIEDDKLSGDYIKLTIDSGLSATDISNLLQANGVCDSTEFLNYVIENNLDTHLKSGIYLIKKNSSVKEIVTSIVETDSTTIKIFPASTINQVDQLLTNRKLIKSGDFLKACVLACKNKGLSFVEGWFTPATYKITNEFDVNLLASTMLENTFKILSPYLIDIAKSGYSIDDIIIISSLIQGETQDINQMPLISSVIHNRLKNDVALGIDATTRYELGDWNIELTKDILDEITPFNTRRQKGLPPSGICLSSKEAIYSAIYPLASDYMYYIHDLDGVLIPAITYEEHLENIDKRDNKQ